MASFARLRAAMRLEGAGLGACEGTTPTQQPSLSRVQLHLLFEESIREESDAFTSDTVAAVRLFIIFFVLVFMLLLCTLPFQTSHTPSRTSWSTRVSWKFKAFAEI